VPEFNGTIQIKENPTSAWETFSHTFEPSPDVKANGYFNLKFSQRAEGGFHRASFDLRGSFDFMSDFLHNALGREVKIVGNDGVVAWEGYIHDMESDLGRVTNKTSLSDMANAAWVRFRVRGSSTTVRSETITDDDSIAKFGRKEFVLSGGELESTDTGDRIAQQYIDLHSWPSPSPARLDPEGELAEYPTIKVVCRGWFDTLDWCVYNQTVDTDSQGASAQVTDIIADTNVGQFIKSTVISANATRVSKEYDADRRGGKVLQDIARLGDQNNNRWIVYMTNDRKIVFEEAQTPKET